MTTDENPGRATTEAWVTHLLVASALGVYGLIIVGAATALLEGAAACPTWPACDGEWIVPLTDPALLAAWSHRVATLLVGALMLVTMGLAWRSADNRVRVALGAAVALYPPQIVLGAMTAVNDASTLLSAVHLVVAMAIFTGVLIALLWHLEAETPTAQLVVRESTGGTVGESNPPLAIDRGTNLKPARPFQRLRDYIRLTKPRLWWLLCLVAVASMGLAAGPNLAIKTVIPTLAGGVLAIAASGTFNNVLESDVDRQMSRTSDRPLVEGRITVRKAVAFGVALSVGSVAVFVAFVNVLAAALGLLAILFYSVVYTLILKPRTPQNIVIGGAVGAFPALIGWAAVENTVGLPALVLGAVIFLWTPAHFYNLALAYRDDYARAGIPMLPVVRGTTVTRRHILLYLSATMLGAVLLGTTTRLGPLYAITAMVVGGVFLWAVVRLHRERTAEAAFRAFHASNAYLGSLLIVVALDAIIL